MKMFFLEVTTNINNHLNSAVKFAAKRRRLSLFRGEKKNLRLLLFGAKGRGQKGAKLRLFAFVISPSSFRVEITKRLRLRLFTAN